MTKFKASFYAKFFPTVNGLRTIGVVIISERQIIFAPVEGFASDGALIDELLASSIAEGMKPGDILRYFVERSNVITYSVSKPQTIEAASMNDAAIMMLRKVEKEYIEVMK